MASDNLSGPARKKFKAASPDASGQPNNAQITNTVPLSQPSSDADHFFDSDDEKFEIPSDTVAALTLLKNEFPKLQGVRLHVDVILC